MFIELEALLRSAALYRGGARSLSSDAGSPQPFRFEIGIWDVRGHLASDRGRCRCAREIGSERSNPLFAESLSITFDGPQSSECAFPCACDRTGLLQIADFVRRKARVGVVPCPDRVPRSSHVETPRITGHIRRCLLKPRRICRVATPLLSGHMPCLISAYLFLPERAAAN